MPIEDFIKLVEDYENSEGIDMAHKQEKSSRILFLNGTRFSNRKDTLIGKMYVDLIYKREIVEATSNRNNGISVANDLYLQKEIYINRKIPLKGYLNVNIGTLSDLKNSLENIEYLMSLYNHPDSRDNLCDRSLLSAHDESNKRTENIDRKRALLKIQKEGLNIAVIESLFEETPELKDRFGTNESRVIFRSHNPNFEYENEHKIKMDTGIFEHIKYRFATFEVRHYFVQNENELLDLGRREDQISDSNSEFQTDNRDYITLGYAKVPMANLITKSNGINQEVAVLDQFNQKLGYLNIKMSLNYQSRKSLKLFKEPKEKFIEGKYFLGFSIIELISQNNKYFSGNIYNEEIKHLLFKFKWKGENHQIRYIPDKNITEFPLNITVYFINKMYLLEIDIDEKTFEESATPIEIQLWTKTENKSRCMKDKEELVGSVFIDIQNLISQRHNLRLRNEAQEIINTHDGYYTVLNNESNSLMQDRVGISTLLIRKESEGQKEQLEKMFYILHNQVRKSILDDYDLNLKGTIEINDMKKILNAFFEDREELDLVYKYLEYLELKNPDCMYYSPYLNVLPPFFKYARRIEKEEIIEFIYKRLSSVDNYENGFVENNMFKSILECEVNLKEKIVDNFVDNLKPNKLDFNLSSHTMKLKTDYLLLIRKLYGYLLHWDILKLNNDQPSSEQIMIHPDIIPQNFPEERKCNLNFSISGANNLKNPINENSPPNTYVCFRNPFEGRGVELRTPIVYKTTFPEWRYEHQIEGIPINEI